MAVTVTHAHVSAIPDDPTKDVSSTKWNEAHTLVGLGTAAEADSTDFATAAQGALADSAVQAIADLSGTMAEFNTACSDGDFAYLGATNSFTAGQTITPAVNASALTVATQTHTASAPIINGAQTWNNAAVTFESDVIDVTDSTSAAASLIFNRKVGGVSKATIAKNGNVSSNGGFVAGLAGVTSAIGGMFQCYDSGSPRAVFGSTYMDFANTYLARWSSGGTSAGTKDLGLSRNAAGVLEVNNGTAGTYRDLKLRNLLAGGGNGSYVQTPSMTVANLAAAGTAGAGARAFVTDATATTFLSTVAGGGANKVPVVSDGTNWLIG